MSFPPAPHVIFTILIAASTLGNRLQAGISAGHFEINSAVELIGYAGSKVFFRDATNTTTTLGGYIKFCNNNSMTAASVENLAESTVITNYLNSTNYNLPLWLGGWDANLVETSHGLTVAGSSTSQIGVRVMVIPAGNLDAHLFPQILANGLTTLANELRFHFANCQLAKYL